MYQYDKNFVQLFVCMLFGQMWMDYEGFLQETNVMFSLLEDSIVNIHVQ